jgi:hypothetical protein
MENANSLSGRKIWLSAVEMCIFLAIATFAPLIGNQYVTGTIVNATLFVSAALLGFQGTLIICFLPSIIALASGTLPLVMAPMIPFIIAGNILLVWLFNLLRKNNYWLGLFSGAMLKFSLLFFASNAIIDLFIKKQVAAKIATMMSYPQLITALVGGAVAFMIIRKFDSKRKI